MMNSNTNLLILNTEKESNSLENYTSKLSELQRHLGQGRKRVLKTRTKVDSMVCPIQKRPLWQFNTIKVADSLIAMHDYFTDVFKSILSKIRLGHDYSLMMLDIIKIQAMLEAELYKHVDNNSLDINEIKNLFRDLCKENGVKDQAFDDMYNSAFERTYILRDRINEIRNELRCYSRQTDNRIVDIEERFDSINAELELKIQQSINDFAVSLNAKMEECTAFFKNESNLLKSDLDIYKEKIIELDSKFLKSLNDVSNSAKELQSQLRLEIIKNQEEHASLLNNKVLDLEQLIIVQNASIQRLSKKKKYNSIFFKISIGAISLINFIGYLYMILS